MGKARGGTRAALAGRGGRAGAVALSALLLAASLPPFPAWPLVFVALAPLFAACRAAGSAAEAAGLGLLWAILTGLVTGGFLPPLVARYFAVSVAEAWLAFGVLALVAWGAHAAALGVLLRGAARWAPAWVTTAGAAFALHELARAHVPIANPWASVAAAFPPGSAWLQVADVLGPAGTALVVASANAGAVVAGLGIARRLDRPSAAIGVGVAVLALATAGAYGLLRLERLDAEATGRVTVALAHLAQGPDVRRDASQDRATVELLAGLAERATATPARVVVFPEHALPFSLEDPPVVAEPLLPRLAAHDVDWLIGSRSFAIDGPTLEMRNSIFLVRGGRIAGRYDKVLLLPFAETRPFAWPQLGRERFAAGDTAPGRPLETRVGRIGVLVCSEAMTPAAARAAVAAGAVALANPSFDGWFATPGAREHQLRLAALRAIETRRAVLRATTRGRTAIVDPSGRVTAVLDAQEPGLLVGEVPLRAGHTIYQRIGDAGAGGFLLLLVALGAGVEAIRGRARADRDATP